MDGSFHGPPRHAPPVGPKERGLNGKTAQKASRLMPPARGQGNNALIFKENAAGTWRIPAMPDPCHIASVAMGGSRMEREWLLRMLKRLSAWLFWPGLLLVTWGELMPKAPEPMSWDKADHFTAYFGLAGMVTLALARRRLLLPCILGIVLFSGLLEILQGYTGRDPEWGDFLANGIGTVAGLAGGLVLRRLLKAPRPLVARRASD